MSLIAAVRYFLRQCLSIYEI